MLNVPIPNIAMLHTLTDCTFVRLVPAFKNSDLPNSVTMLYLPVKSTGTCKQDSYEAKQNLNCSWDQNGSVCQLFDGRTKGNRGAITNPTQTNSRQPNVNHDKL